MNGPCGFATNTRKLFWRRGKKTFWAMPNTSREKNCNRARDVGFRRRKSLPTWTSRPFATVVHSSRKLELATHARMLRRSRKATTVPFMDATSDEKKYAHERGVSQLSVREVFELIYYCAMTYGCQRWRMDLTTVSTMLFVWLRPWFVQRGFLKSCHYDEVPKYDSRDWRHTLANLAMQFQFGQIRIKQQ